MASPQPPSVFLASLPALLFERLEQAKSNAITVNGPIDILSQKDASCLKKAPCLIDAPRPEPQLHENTQSRTQSLVAFWSVEQRQQRF